MPIYISSLVDMPNLVRRFDVRDLVSVIQTSYQPPTPPEIDPERHHRCAIHDIVQPKRGETPPETRHIEDLIEFLDRWNRETPLLVHCLAGVSRSTAVALIAHMLKTGDPWKSATALRNAASYARPNQRIVALADSILGLDGALVQALEAMGPADWEKEPTYVPPRLRGYIASGHKPERYATLSL